MPDPIDDLSQRWKRNPDAASTIALCEALRHTSRPTLVQQVGQLATKKHGSQVPVLLAVARMYLDAQLLSDAQSVLVAAGKVAPREGGVYRWLGEVLLRRGDAERAEKVLERATQLGSKEPDTGLWLERARVFKVVQAKAGARAVAMEIAAAAAPPPRPKAHSVDDEGTTEVRPASSIDGFEKVLRPAAGAKTNALRPNDDRNLSNNAETVPFPTPVGHIRTELEYALKRETGDVEPTQLMPAASAPSPKPPSPGPRHLMLPTPEPRPMAPPTPEPLNLGHSEATGPRPIAPPTPEPLNLARPPTEEPLPVKARTPPPPEAARPRAPLPSPRRRDVPMEVPRTEPPPAVAGVPAAKDVLDALALAGVFEREGRAGGVFRWDKPTEKTRRRSSIVLGAVMAALVGLGIGVFKYVGDQREKARVRSEAILQTVETDIETSKVSLLPDIESRLGHAFELDSRSKRAALDWLHERALVGIMKGSAEVAFEDAIARATEVGVPEAEFAFARVAAFLFQGDTAGAVNLFQKWDGPAANDAWYQLLAGATLERAGDPRALERYAAAVRLDPNLLIAQILQAQSTAIDGDPTKAADLAKQFKAKYEGRPEGAALVGLAWGRDPTRGEQAPPEVADVIAHPDDLPLPLAAVPHALAALAAIDKHGDPRPEITKGLAVADGPGVASWMGSIALDARDEGLVQKAALLAVGFSAVYPPARVLAARVALLGGRFDQALKATEDMDPSSPDVAIVRAASAYERTDPSALTLALDALSPEAKKLPFMNAVVLAPEVLAGRAAQATGPKILEMSNDEAPWSDLVAMDLALDLGELDVADKIGASWKGSEDKPLRALRLSRLARYQNKIDQADALSRTALDSGTVTPRTLEERVFVLVAKNKPQEVVPLLAKYPLVLGPSATWLGAYAMASMNKISEAQGKIAALDPPPPAAPLPARVIAAVALAAAKDKKRGVEYVKSLLSSGIQDPDLVAAAVSLGFKRIDHARKRATYE